MTRVLINDQSLYDIADSIRGKLGVETLYLPSDMADAIESIETGTDLTSEDEGKVVVEDEGSYVLAEQTSLSVSANGTYDTTTNDEVVVEVSGGVGTVNIGDGNNLLRNSDFSLNTTGLTAWDNTGSSQAPAINFWHITYASLSVNQDGSVRLARNGRTDAYLIQLFLPSNLGSLVGKTVKIVATINGVTYTSVGVLASSGDSVSTNTPYGTLRVYKYTNYYGVTVDIQDSAAEYIDISGVAFGLEDELVYPPSLTTKTITQNGTYNASDDNANGYSSVTVNVSGGSVSDNDLLFHFDNFRNSGKCAAAFANVTGMEISDEQSKFGGHSLKFLGSQTLNNVAIDQAFSFGTDDFTIDFWAYPTSLPSSGSVPFSFNYRSIALYLESNRLHCAVASSSGSWAIEPTATVTIPTNEWSHFALVRDGSDIHMFLNGVKVSTTDFGSNTIAPVSLLTLGSNTYTSGNRRFAGYLDELRIKLGEAVWTDDFTPPTQPYV